jgi:hypothetical protein
VHSHDDHAFLVGVSYDLRTSAEWLLRNRLAWMGVFLEEFRQRSTVYETLEATRYEEATQLR